MRLAGLAAALLCIASAPVARAESVGGCEITDRACLMRASRAHPAKTVAFWRETLARPVAERLGPAPQGLVDFLWLDNAFQGFPERPRPSRLDAAFLADVRGAIADLPPAVARVFGGNFAGVWFVDDLGGTGYTDMILDPAGRPVGGFVVLDAKVLGRFTANEWATWKENTPFKPRTGWSLKATIEAPGADDRRGAIRYILLHELGHVLAIGRDVHPSWQLAPREVPAGTKYPFFDLSWTVDRAADRYASRWDAAFPQRTSVRYYLGAKLDASHMPAVYASLAGTNFPTLYAATSPGDDFAESFASYVHTVMLRRPWEIAIRQGDRTVATWRPGWDTPRMAEKRRLLEALLR